ncbi:unnamed protein product [Rotaria sp. Silwood2]|nr:unnamed protein product [Rotaria sp. Silwood2]
MLSTTEYNKIKWQLDHILATITGPPRQHLRTTFKKKLHEHKLATTYPPFQQSNYEQFFISFRTNDSTLHHLIEQVKSSTIFTLDTESIIIPHKPNKPALIQIQIILSHSFSYVIFIEVCHLPPTNEPTFQLIQTFFQTLFNINNNIFIWGDKNELDGFLSFNLFTYDDINTFNDRNLQSEFKNYWNRKHPHQLKSSSSTNDSECICESCLGLQSNNTWSLQNAVAYELHQWLDKRKTKSSFDIGLDPHLYHFNSSELEYRQSLTQYATYDCLSMQQLLLKLNLVTSQELIVDSLNEIYIIMSNDLTPPSPHTSNIPITINISQQQSNQAASAITVLIQTANDNMNDLEAVSSDDDEHQQREILNEQQRNPLTIQERKRIHNRSNTLKQRQRSYKHEIIQRDIDKRFTITDIKNVLRQHSIKFCAVNTSISPTTNKKSLYHVV